MKTIVQGKIIYLKPASLSIDKKGKENKITIFSWEPMTPDEIRLYEESAQADVSLTSLIRTVGKAMGVPVAPMLDNNMLPDAIRKKK